MVVNNRGAGQEPTPDEIRNKGLEEKRSAQRTKELGGRKGNI